ncbi:RsbRD N-terminal domain-containing protein, partial [Archangium sp.]|uniref:RsbRD N-terminal domain-containing protein n=1 Tax=Archangium sp. TaxID=1872627 RepID=UPI00389B08F8
MVKEESLGPKQARLSLGTFIREHHARILEAWERSVRQLPSSRGLSRPRLLDHLPDLLERISRVVSTVQTGEHETLAGLPEVHALERLDSGFDLDEVAEEYGLLRACILELYGELAQASGLVSMAEAMREVVSFNRTFDEAVSAAVSRYARAHERTLLGFDWFWDCV